MMGLCLLRSSRDLYPEPLNPIIPYSPDIRHPSLMNHTIALPHTVPLPPEFPPPLPIPYPAGYVVQGWCCQQGWGCQGGQGEGLTTGAWASHGLTCPLLPLLLCSLHRAGAQVVIALTHMRVPNDTRLAEEAPEIHLILGGHDHHYEVRSYCLFSQRGGGGRLGPPLPPVPPFCSLWFSGEPNGLCAFV